MEMEASRFRALAVNVPLAQIGDTLDELRATASLEGSLKRRLTALACAAELSIV
jgi:hypothetical protein